MGKFFLASDRRPSKHWPLFTKPSLIENLKEANVQSELISVIGRGVNEDQIPHIINFCIKNRDFIDTVNFDCLITGKDYKEYTMSSSRLYKLVSESIGIDLDYFIESKRFRYNMYNLFERISRKYSVSHRMLAYEKYFFEIDGDKLKPVVSVAELRRLNDLLEIRDNPIKFIFSLIKNIGTFSKLGSAFISRLIQIYVPKTR